jgi:hypothetical protein
VESFPEFIAFAAGTFRDPEVALQAARHCYTWKKALRVALCNLYSITTNQAAMIAWFASLTTTSAIFVPFRQPLLGKPNHFARANDW